MNATGTIRWLLMAALLGGFTFASWQLLSSAPASKRERPAAPVPLVDIVDSRPASHPLVLEASGPVVSAFELEIRPQVGGRIVALHPDFEPGGRIPAGEPIMRIEPDDYQLAIQAAEAEIAKAQAAITLERGRRVVAREELQSLQGSLNVDAESKALALRKPQLRQVEAELAAARNRLQRAELDLARTEITLPFDVVVLQRSRVTGEVVAARELVGQVSRADEY
ncbi:MAG: biotin/lipoyl-binding protein [Gammaproteobacteria bacterium]|nr:biotin/lipoyl-binding protein [Gammaproteobacteria bacterium]